MAQHRSLAAFVTAIALAVVALMSAGAASAVADDVVQPADVTVRPGETATFTTSAPGAFMYEWYRVASPADVRVKSWNPDGTYSLVATEADDGAQFYATYLAGGKILRTRTAMLVVGDGSARIVTAPQDASVLAGRPARFEVTARGQGTLTYQWERSDDDGATWDGIPGATAARLDLRPAVADDGARFRVVVRSTVGEPATSAAATLTVRPLTGTAEPVAHASLEWGINAIYQGGNPAGNGCNFFSAGKTTGFDGAEGDVRIVHRTATGLVSVSEGTKCANDGGANTLGQRVLFTEGTGTANPATGEATISWDGAFTANGYSGLVPWYLEDPELTVAADGTGTLKATAGGKGADRTDPTNPFDVPPREVVVATFPDVEVTADGVVVRPDFAGVDYFPLVDGVRSSTSAIADVVKAGNASWGSWPQSFVDFHYETELSSYWHTSGLSADPDKPPYPFTAQYAAAPAIAEVPDVLAGPDTTTAPPFVEGRDVTVTTDVEGATSLQWERASSPTGTWTAIQDDAASGVAGATTETLTLSAITAGWNGAYVRVRATNADGTVTSSALRLTTKPYQALAFTVQPQDAITIAGSRIELHGRATGHPAPVQADYGVQVSTDDGRTWTALSGVDWSSSGTAAGDDFTVASVPASLDGALYRLVARNADGDTVTSSTARLTVVPATGEPQLAVAPAAPIDPAKATTLTVVGAGFTIPDSPAGTGGYALDLGVFTTEGWQPGQTAHRDWLATSSDSRFGQLYQGRLEDSGGWFSVALTIPAGTLQPGDVHGVGAFLRLAGTGGAADKFDDRSGDAWTPLVLTGQAPAAIATPPSDVRVLPDERVELTAAATGTPAPSVRWQRRAAGEGAWADVPGATGDALAFTARDEDDGSAYRLVADNRLGPAAVSAPAVVRVGAEVEPKPETPRPQPQPAPPAAQPTPAPGVAVPSQQPRASAPSLVRPSTTLRLGASRTATVGTVVCPAGGAACRITAPKQVRVTIGGRRFTVAVRTARSIRAGGRAAVRIRVPSAAARRLRGRGTTVTFTVRVATGGRTTAVRVRAKVAAPTG